MRFQLGQDIIDVLRRKRIKFYSSELAYTYLKGLRGIEIGGASYCDFKLNTLNIDVNDNMDSQSPYYKEQMKYTKHVKHVDIVSKGDDLPFKDNIWDFVISSHVLEHFWNPIKALHEWMRVIKPCGYIFMIIPHKERTDDKNRPRTTLQELIERQTSEVPKLNVSFHYSVWLPEDIIELCKYLNMNVIEMHETDDTRHDGFTVIIQK